jgi:hypothetical protein
MTKIEKNKVRKKLSSFDQNLQFTYPYASLKERPSQEKAFNPQKRTSSTSKH